MTTARLPSSVVAIELGDLDRRLRAGRQESLVAQRHQAGVERMDPVDVLGGHDRVGQDAQRNVPRQRLLHDDPGDLGVVVELPRASAFSSSAVALLGSSMTGWGCRPVWHERRICCT